MLPAELRRRREPRDMSPLLWRALVAAQAARRLESQVSFATFCPMPCRQHELLSVQVDSTGQIRPYSRDQRIASHCRRKSIYRSRSASSANRAGMAQDESGVPLWHCLHYPHCFSTLNSHETGIRRCRPRSPQAMRYKVGLLNSPPNATSPQAGNCASTLKLMCAAPACASRNMRCSG